MASVALVGSESLLGREIRDVLATTNFPAHVTPIAAEEEDTGVLTEMEGEPAVIARLSADAIGDARLAFLAGSPESTRAALELAVLTPLIDLTHAAEDHPRARIRAPQIEPAGYSAPAGTVHVIAHPASIALALILNPLHGAFPIRRVIAHVFEPASERGKPGIDELQQQTVSLLSFKGQPKKIYDAQLSFNMLARYGEEAPRPLEDFELRLERHLATLLSQSSHAPMPSLRLIQAPVFHGHSFSLWLEFEQNPGVPEIERALTATGVDVRASDQEPPHIVGVAGQEGVAVGAISMDRNCTQASWIWAAADNLRLMATNAVLVARQLL